MEKIKYVLLIAFVLFLQGCSIHNSLPNKKRVEHFMGHGPTFHDHFYKVHYGMSKYEVIENLGPAHDFKSENVWIYSFPDDWINVFYIKFEDGKIVKTWN